MLKIRDDVNLKELEKFGFIKLGTVYTYGCIYVSISTRELDIGLGVEPELLFDLIQAGLVEKVVE